MLFKHISNTPEERSRISYSWRIWDHLFNDQELNALNDYVSTLEVEKATTQLDMFSQESIKVEMGNNETSQGESRVSAVKFLTVVPETEWIFNRFNWVIEQLNHYFYGYDLNGYDSIQYGVYDAAELGRYDWHMDTHMDTRVDNYFETRKLSISFMLNEPGVDFEGGELQINNGVAESKAEKVPLKKGDLVCFPSFLLHRVAPVTRGMRKSLVIWVTGPKFK